jgi:hypothetical protein
MHPIGQRCTDDQPTIKGRTSANFGYSKPYSPVFIAPLAINSLRRRVQFFSGRRGTVRRGAGLAPAGSHQLCLAHLFEDLVGEREECGWDHDAKQSRGLLVDDQLELGRLYDRQLGRFFSFEDTSHIDANKAVAF